MNEEEIVSAAKKWDKNLKERGDDVGSSGFIVRELVKAILFFVGVSAMLLLIIFYLLGTFAPNVPQ